MCVDGLCKAGDDPQPDCEVDGECPGDQVCLNGACVPPVGSTCEASGCSGEICAAEPMDSICIYEDWYECLKLSKCGNYGEDGACGWQQNSAYLQCLEDLDGGGGGDEGCLSDADCPDGESCQCLPDPDCPACAVCWFGCAPKAPTECMVSGCSGEVCAAESWNSICIWEPWYECLKLTECGNNGPGGSCGWEPNEEFLDCMAQFDTPGGDECAADFECKDGYVCVNGQCTWKEDEPDWCDTDADCDPGYVCQCDIDPWTNGLVACFNVCVPEEGAECSSDADCPDGQVCGDMGCPDCECPPDPAVPCACGPCFGTCEDAPPNNDLVCHGDEQCPDSWICNLWDYCLPPPGCQPGMDCPAVCYGLCEPPPPDDYECQTDADCKDGQVCDQVMCSGCACGPNEPCDCPAEPECWGWCADPGPEPTDCWSDADCAEGELCQFDATGAAPVPCDINDPNCGGFVPWPGQCVPQPPQEDACISDDECAPGWQCNTWDYCLSPPFCEPNEPCPDVCYGMCEPAPPQYECSDDADCKDGLVCQYETCETCACEPNAPCDCEAICYGWCVDPGPQWCYADSDCADGQICEWFAPKPCDPADPSCGGAPAPPPPGQCVPAPTECKPTGCSSQVCAAEDVITTCEAAEWMMCLAYTDCGNYAPGGGCGWEQNPEFLACMAQFGM